ncbi:MAG TPA: ABC transporter substrate-binding protein [Micropepsaceae bacterium]|nr:ABC transporter substrate-binding protein [Micropepsaceae bacterium]
MRIPRIIAAALAVSIGWAAVASANMPPPPLRHVRFVTDWRAQAEHGGFYQAIANGYYRQRGLDVEIIQGGPAINVPQLLAAGEVEFGMGSNSFIPLNMVAEGIPVRAVAAIFQKDPQVLICHPRDDINSIADMAGKPVMVSDATIGAFWIWLRAKFGFRDSEIRKYTFNLAPFLSDTGAIQQGYLTSEPFLIRRDGGFEPEVYLLSDYGYPGYANMILARDETIAGDPALVADFVWASRLGWHDYLTGDPTPGNELIKRDNPEMTDDVLAQAIVLLRENGIAGDVAQGAGVIGPMTDERWKEFFTLMAGNAVYPVDLDYTRAFTTEFTPPLPAE